MDTGAFKARADVADVHHQTALACFEETTSQRLPFYVTNATIWEAYTRLRYDLGYVEAAELFPLVDTLGATVVRVKADRPADGLIAFAQREGITHVIFGQSSRGRLEILMKGSTLNRFLEEVKDAAGQVVPL